MINKCKKHKLEPTMAESKNLMGDWRYWMECSHKLEKCQSDYTNSEDLAIEGWNKEMANTKETYVLEKFKPYDGSPSWRAVTTRDFGDGSYVQFKTFKQYGVSQTKFEVFRGNEKIKSIAFGNGKIENGARGIETATKKVVHEYHRKSEPFFDKVEKIAREVLKEQK